MKKDEPKNMSIEQAGNYIKEKTENAKHDIKQEVKDKPISFASVEDRVKFLKYGISLLNNISEFDKNKWCKITGKAEAMYSTKEVTKIIRQLLVLRVNGYPIKVIADFLKTTPMVVSNCEQLGIRIIKDNIDKIQKNNVPIVGLN